MNNTTLVFLKVRFYVPLGLTLLTDYYHVQLYSALIFGTCIVSFLCFSLPGELHCSSCPKWMRSTYQKNFSLGSELWHLASACIIVFAPPFSSKHPGSFQSRSALSMKGMSSKCLHYPSILTRPVQVQVNPRNCLGCSAWRVGFGNDGLVAINHAFSTNG